MKIELLRILIDFGLFVLIWLVQLIIYPSFKYYHATNLFNWHKTYTSNIAIVVMPLMLGQLIVYGFLLFTQPTNFNIFGFIITVSLWISTFLQFVPLHSTISNREISEKLLNQLVLRNWLRTSLWTILFFSSLFDYIFPLA